MKLGPIVVPFELDPQSLDAANAKLRAMRSEMEALGGPTLRDQFAMAALTGLLSSEEGHLTSGPIDAVERYLGLQPGTYRYDIHWPMAIAKMSYTYADAMLAAREVKP